MIRNYLTLEVVCHREGKKDEKLVLENGKYVTKPIINRAFMLGEGPLSRIENQKVNLFNFSDINNLELPSDIDGFSVVLYRKTNYESNNCTICVTANSSTLASVGNNLFIYESESDNVSLVSPSELTSSLKKVAFATRKYLEMLEIKEMKSMILSSEFKNETIALTSAISDINISSGLVLTKEKGATI